jgi:hypothetical protein
MEIEGQAIFRSHGGSHGWPYNPPPEKGTSPGEKTRAVFSILDGC